MDGRICIFASLILQTHYTDFHPFYHPICHQTDMKRIFLLYLLLMVSLAGRAQGEAIRTKLSATTRMLMSELREKESAGDRGGRRTKGRTELPDEDGEEETSVQRSYAEPVMIDRRRFVSSFLRLRDGTDVRELEARGVRIQSRFKNGLVTAWIPVDGIEEVAEVENVTHINVSPVAMVHSDAARRETRVEDILTQSAAVTAAMNAFSRELLSTHVKTCVVEDIRRGDEDTVDELVDLLRKLMR